MKQYYQFAGLLLSQAAFAQAPVITTLSPGRNGETTNRAASVVTTFSQPLNTSAPSTVLRVFSNQRGGRLAGSLLVSGNTLTFDPTRDFRVGEEVSVTATTGIQNSSGVALATPQVYRFRVRPVGGTGAFGAPAAVAVGGQPAFVVTADVDGDGDLDLLTANQFDNTVSVRLNNGLGVFSGGSTVAVGSAPTSVEAADVDGDGDLDLLCSNRSSATVSVRLNNGTGTFSGGSDVTVGTLPAAVTTADIDGDGDLDLLAATNTTPAVVSVRLNNGSGSFSGGTDVAASFLLNAIATADLDNDGDVDVLASVQGINASNLGSIVVLLNNGSGGFSRGTDISVGPDPRGLAVGDIDNDGDLDLLTANYGSSTNSVSVRLNSGTGVLGGSTELPIGSESRSVALADIDSDGDLDLLVAATSPGINVFRNSGTGVFTLANTYTVGAPYHIKAADFDNDGDLDLVTSNYFSSSAEVRLNNGTGTPLAVQLPQSATRLTLWPNPTRSRVQLTGVGANQEVLLLDVVGRIMMRQTADGVGNAAMDLPAGLAPGTYIVSCLGKNCLLTVE